MQDITNSIASTHLGQKSALIDKYDPSLLVAIPRIENRRQYNIKNENLPFLGFDVWHAYEFSVLLNNNLPITRVLKLKYSSDSEFLIESKSLKLYLNSFNMTNYGENIEECLNLCKKTIEKDLSNALKTPVEVEFLNENNKKTTIFKNFKNILNFINLEKIKIEKFEETPELIEAKDANLKEYYLKFNSLRSNCRVTHQPDFGDIFIYYKSKKHILEDSLIKYLCSFRKEYHFHEECVEMIFKRLLDVLNEKDKLFVCALYTRRGGIDINPIRYTKNCKNFASNLINLKKYTRSSIKQ